MIPFPEEEFIAGLFWATFRGEEFTFLAILGEEVWFFVAVSWESKFSSWVAFSAYTVSLTWLIADWLQPNNVKATKPKDKSFANFILLILQ